jgi:hypothetical protein
VLLRSAPTVYGGVLTLIGGPTPAWCIAAVVAILLLTTTTVSLASTVTALSLPGARIICGM